VLPISLQMTISPRRTSFLHLALIRSSRYVVAPGTISTRRSMMSTFGICSPFATMYRLTPRLGESEAPYCARSNDQRSGDSVTHFTDPRIAFFSMDGKPVVDEETYSVSLDRLCWVVARTTAGLFARELGHRLPTDEYLVGANLATEVAFDQNPILGWGREKLLMSAEIVIAPSVYRYRYACLRPDPNCTVWWHTFYDAVEFIAATLPTKEVDGQDTT